MGFAPQTLYEIVAARDRTRGDVEALVTATARVTRPVEAGAAR
jgi:hypothetical protein